jgi:hypothetical protein
MRGIPFAATLSLLARVLTSSLPYPWSGTLEQRQQEILVALRDDMLLEMDESILPLPLDNQSKSILMLNNVYGTAFTCGIQIDSNVISNNDQIPLHFYDSELLSHKLKNTCSALTIDYWTYEWCHRRSVNQFHIVTSKDMSRRDPMWSLGDYQQTTVIRERNDNNNMSAAIIQIVDSFDNGQRCDETNGPRHSEANFLFESCIIFIMLI